MTDSVITDRTRDKHRVEILDYLRGLLALAVMVYHFFVWSGAVASGEVRTALYGLALYGVLMFYVISGISFGHVYRRMEFTRAGLSDFWVKRFFRLIPLYWLAMIGAMALMVLNARREGRWEMFPFTWSVLPSLDRILLNATLNFGLVNPRAYIVTGGWSIGNEMVFYLLFPGILWSLRRSRWAYASILFASLALCVYFAFSLLDPRQPLADQWGTYIHPAGQVYLFVAGVGIAALMPILPTLRVRWLAALVALLLISFVAIPLRGDGITLVTGANRLVYSAICIALCAAAYRTPLRLPERAHGPFAWLGKASYSVYLLHPVVYGFVLFALAGDGRAAALVATPLVFVVSYLAYRWLEEPMIRKGRDVAKRLARTGDAAPSRVPGGTVRDQVGSEVPRIAEPAAS